MKIDKTLIEHIAKLSKIKLSEKEIEKFTEELKEALEYFSKLNELDTENIKPSFHPVEIKNVFRDDVIGKCLKQDEALSLTKHKKDGYFKGPKII